MNSDKSKVAVFIVVGILVAGVIGTLVWRSGSPTNPSVTDTATTSQLSSTPDPVNALASPAALPTTPGVSAPDTEDLPPAPAGADISMPAADDPFLAPHAVVVAPERVSPTTVYRPDNIGEELTAATSPSTLAAPAITGSATPPATSPQPSTSEPADDTPPAEGESALPETSTESPEPTAPTESSQTDSTQTDSTPATETELPEFVDPVEDATDSLTQAPTTAQTGPSEQVAPSPAPSPAPSLTPEASAPAPAEQNLQGATPDQGSGSGWSWSTVRGWLPW
ncbi:hypothetical protein [Corynebacterium guangdongense]|uniref:Uncharacterized protein n=1 Tax=Corynebacterium guangdongense TaxID=1783348 RepID=A0ABU1ZWE6_9CORY|nr:hypothetical protein [Corynebacterium guangdongense]MDR7328693.1 hypothetical protein [Corynebacterium guangdongense]WJZ17270.1 hypothetical protein CGUA_03370 [Corynebacterium guangdongense]